MYSLHKISVSLLFVLFSLTSRGGNPYDIASASGMGMGSLCTTRTGLWSSFINTAQAAGMNSMVAGVNYENRFGLQELGKKSVAAIIPSGKTPVGFLYSYFGNHDYRRQTIILSSGKYLTEKISGGITAEYYSEKVSGEYNDNRFISFRAGMVARVTEKTSLSISVFNPLPNSLREADLPSAIIVGAGMRLSDAAFFGAEAEMVSGRGMNVRTGFEYSPSESFRFRGGFSTENTSFSIGLGYAVKKVNVDLGFASHERLGITSAIGIEFKI